MGRLQSWVVVPFVAALSLVGCGGSSKDGDDSDGCANAAACGGDIVGAWQISSTCLTFDSSTMSNDDCPGQTTRVADWDMTGNFNFNADLTYSANATQTGTVVTTLPASCLMRQGITLSCAQLEDALQANLADSGFSSGTCSVSAGNGCACTIVTLPQSSNASGTYTTSGSGVLTQTETGGSPDSSNYCVKGSTLTLSPTASEMSGVAGSLTLTKQ